jgi:transcriptional regulator with XRE-family HTH domain
MMHHDVSLYAEVTHVMPMYPQAINERIRQWRLDNNLSQQELASGLGVGIATIQRWESGDTTPGQRHRAMLEQVLGNPANQRHGIPLWLSDGYSLLFPRLVDIGAQLRETTQGNRRTAPTNMWCDDAQLMPPIPCAAEEKANVRKGGLEVRIDQALLDLFDEEKQLRGLTESKLVEAILWHRYNKPELSFQKPRKESEKGSQEGSHAPSIGNDLEKILR